MIEIDLETVEALLSKYAQAAVVADREYTKSACDAEEVAAEKVLAPYRELVAEVERLTEHSISLNTIGWKIATVLGDVPPGAEQICGDPIGQAERLIAEVQRLREQVAHPPRLVTVTGQPWEAFPVLQQAVREQRGRIEELEAQRDQVLALHVEHEGRCVHCVEYCDCLCPDVCGHGNVEWPCPTAAIHAEPEEKP